MLKFLAFARDAFIHEAARTRVAGGGIEGRALRLVANAPSSRRCGRWRSARQCCVGVWHRAAGARGRPAGGVHVHMERRGVSQPLWRNWQGRQWRSSPGRGNWPFWREVGPKELREPHWAGVPTLNVKPFRVRTAVLACDAGNLRACVPSTCTHTVSKLSSQFLFEETEALRASGLGSRSHSSGFSSSFLGAHCGLHCAKCFSHTLSCLAFTTAL